MLIHCVTLDFFLTVANNVIFYFWEKIWGLYFYFCTCISVTQTSNNFINVFGEIGMNYVYVLCCVISGPTKW